MVLFLRLEIPKVMEWIEGIDANRIEGFIGSGEDHGHSLFIRNGKNRK